MSGTSTPRTVLQLEPPSTGGIRRHVIALTALLRARDWQVAVAGPTGVFDGLGLEAEVVEVPTRLEPVGLFRAVRQLRRILPGNAVIHAHGLKAGWTAVLSRPGVPIVLTIHNVVLDEVAGRGARLQRRLERALLGRVDHVITASPAICEQFADAVEPGRIQFVLPVTPPAIPRRSRSEIRRALGVAEEAVLVVVVARLHPQKDLPLFIWAWSRVAAAHPSARAVIIGEGPDATVLEQLIVESGVADSLRLIGSSPNAVDEMGASDIVAFSSLWEGVPLSAVEAKQLGRPIVSTDVGVVSLLLASGGGAVVPVGDREAFAATLVEYVGSADVRAAASGIDETSGDDRYGDEALTDAVIAIYERVLDA